MTLVLTSLSFLERGQPFPPDTELKRLRRYRENKLLFEDEHAKVYKEQFNRIECVIGNFDRVVSYATILNYQKLMTLKMADLTFGQPPKISVADDNKQVVIDRIVYDTDLYNKLYVSAIDVSRYGDSIMQISKSDNGKAQLNITAPTLWFPVVNQDNIKEFEYHCFCWVYIVDSKREKYGLRVQIHKPREPSVCEEHSYELDGEAGRFKIGKEISNQSRLILETQLDVCPIYRVSNTQTSDRCFGIDDYSSIDSIISELIVRISQISKVLDKFASPSMTGPASSLTYNDTLGRWELKAAEYYVRENDTDPAPEYLTWDANMEASFKQIELLINQLYSISEMGSALFGDLSNSTGNVTSGTALRRLMMSPLAKARRIANSYDNVIKQVISACASIYNTVIEPSEISITWNDGLPSDPIEEANIMDIRTGGKATISRYTAIRRLDGLSDKDTDMEIAMIEEDNNSDTMGTAPPNDYGEDV